MDDRGECARCELSGSDAHAVYPAASAAASNADSASNHAAGNKPNGAARMTPPQPSTR